MRIDRAGWPFIAGALAPGAVALVARRPAVALPFAALGGFMAYFFRDPARQPPPGDHLILAPADGRVMAAGAADPVASPPGDWQQVSIFLSPMDVHVNRIPFTGTVRRVEYRPGRFLPAYRHEAGSENEQSEIWIERDGQTVVARQIVGLLARRVVCRVTAGARVRAGDRYGIMKFGSRMDVFFPPAATLYVQEGDRTVGGETVMAVLPPTEDR